MLTMKNMIHVPWDLAFCTGSKIKEDWSVHQSGICQRNFQTKFEDTPGSARVE